MLSMLSVGYRETQNPLPQLRGVSALCGVPGTKKREQVAYSVTGPGVQTLGLSFLPLIFCSTKGQPDLRLKKPQLFT